MTPEQAKALVLRLVIEAEQDGNLDLIDEIVAPDFVDHTPLPGVPPTREGIKALFAALQAGFPGLKVEVLDQVAESGAVATRKRFTGTHGGTFLGAPATGGPLDLTVIDILKIKDGKISDHWVVLDQLTLLTQIGAMPARS